MACPIRNAVRGTGDIMQNNTHVIRVAFNEDDEIIARLDECQKIKNGIEVDKRIDELKQSLAAHVLY